MQITINQDEIEQAIMEHIESQLSLKEDQEISIDLKATRGAEGMTATIDIQKPNIKKPKPSPEKEKSDSASVDKGKKSPAKEKPEPKEEPVPEKEVVEDTATNDEEADAAFEETETADKVEDSVEEKTEEPAQEKPKSLFGNLQKPTNS